MSRRRVLRGASALIIAAAAAALQVPGEARAEKVLRVGMTVADIPSTTGVPDQGAEGERFSAITLYDSLVAWDLTATTKPSDLVPALAQTWSVDAATQRTWTFRLRDNVKFHDGTTFDAAAAVWNLDKLLKKDAPQYDARQAAQASTYLTSVASYRAVDAHTLEIVTKKPNALLPYSLTQVWFASPAQWQKVGRDWAAFAGSPAGTGPFKLDKLVPRERAELVANKAYWNPKRVPAVDRVVLLPIPDAGARTAALLSGQLDWIEAPSYDSLDRIKAAGFRITSNSYPHVWPWMLNTTDGSPLKDVRVRRALNLAIDRAGIVKLVGNYAYEAVGAVRPGSPWFGTPEFKIKYDPAGARKLLEEAGYGPSRPLKLKVVISSSGSGQMAPLPMNEYIQQNLAKVGVQVEFEVLEWNTLRARRNKGALAPENKGVDAINSSWVTTDPYVGFVLMLDSGHVAPNGINFGHVKDEVIDAAAARLANAFDARQRDAAMAQLHARFVDQAYWLFVVHDGNVRAMSPKVKGYIPAQSWHQDLATVRID
jgi:ABC-type transport system substrate-binding protein